MPKSADLTGQKFSRLTAIEPTMERRNGRIMWRFMCECGNEILAQGSSVALGNTRSCGCLKLEAITALKLSHGKCHTRLYRIWCRIKQRCLNDKCSDYGYYGGKGITICARWADSFAAFAEDVGDSGHLTLDRINNEKGYEPGNVRWATRKQQSDNSRKPKWVEIDGRRLNYSDWARELGMRECSITMRIKRGMTPEQAVTTPKHQ